MTDLLRVELAGPVATVTLNRPAARNALSRALRDELRSLIAELDSDPAVRAVVLTGADPAFCAGVDVRELGADPGLTDDIRPSGAPFLQSTTPLIGAINGAAYTGGLELALACHFLIASERAAFADTHARLGLTPGWGLTVLLPTAVGVRRARQMTLSCAPIDARTSLSWGLVNEVTPHADLIARAQQVATQISANDEVAVSALSRLYAAQDRSAQQEAWELEAAAWLGTDPETVPDQPNVW